MWTPGQICDGIHQERNVSLNCYSWRITLLGDMYLKNAGWCVYRLIRWASGNFLHMLNDEDYELSEINVYMIYIIIYMQSCWWYAKCDRDMLRCWAATITIPVNKSYILVSTHTCAASKTRFMCELDSNVARGSLQVDKVLVDSQVCRGSHKA